MSPSLAHNPTEFPAQQGHFLIDGPSGALEILTNATEENFLGIGIICHPHPLHQGTMTNKVVHTIARAFNLQGIHSVRFNFRGVGQSQGSYGDSIGEVDDLMAVVRWVKTLFPKAPIWLAGFSFGSFIAARGASQIECQQLFSIAPAVTNQPYNELPIIACPWLVIQGEEDEVIPPQAVYDWVEHSKQRDHIQLIKLPATSHFFHGQLVPLRSIIEKAIRT